MTELMIFGLDLSKSKSFNNVTSSGDRILRIRLRGTQFLELNLQCLEQDSKRLDQTGRVTRHICLTHAHVVDVEVRSAGRQTDKRTEGHWI